MLTPEQILNTHEVKQDKLQGELETVISRMTAATDSTKAKLRSLADTCTAKAMSLRVSADKLEVKAKAQFLSSLEYMDAANNL